MANKSRTQRLLDSMRIIAPGVTHRDANGGTSGGLITSLGESINSILSYLTRIPPTPPALELSEEDTDIIPLGIPGQPGQDGKQGPVGLSIPSFDTSDDTLIPIGIPGQDGKQGPAGPALSTPLIFEQEERESIVIQGPTGANGTNGKDGLSGPIAIDPEDAASIPIGLPTGGVTKIIGTTNQVVASTPDGNVVLSLPQSIDVASSPTFLNLTISNLASSPLLTLNTASGRRRGISSTTGGVGRWILSLGDEGAETGSDAGSNFDLYAFTDAGVNTDLPIQIVRASGGLITLGGSSRPTKFTGPVQNEIGFTNVAGSVSGQITVAMPYVGSQFKMATIYCNGLNGTASWTFPTAFLVTPQIISQSLAARVTALSLTACTITGLPSTGIIQLSGF